ncbi:Cupin superfamily protein [Paraburkholderia sp. BL18I3N2]|nr:Cupin superfamily protein [Paraburkholderia sp. BL18I3N2]
MENVFQKFFYPLDAREFRSQYFGKRPLYLGGHPDRTSGLFSLSQFYECLIECENVRVVFDGLKQARISPGDAKDMFDAGGTICATGVERGNAALREFLKAIKAELNFTGHLSFRAYLSPPGAGFAPHYDPRVIATMQIEGSKKWFYANSPFCEFPLDSSPIPLPQRYLTFVENAGHNQCKLKPGDLLCLPAGTIHWAEAGSDSLSLNLAFDYIGDSIAERIARHVRNATECHPRSRQAVFLPLSVESKTDVDTAINLAIEALETLRHCSEQLYETQR